KLVGRAHDSDNREPGVLGLGPSALNPLADWIFTRPVATRRSFIDDRDSRRFRGVVVGELLAASKRNAHRRKVVGTDYAVKGSWPFSRRRNRSAFDHKTGYEGVAAERQIVHRARPLHPGQRSDSLYQ